MTQPQKNAVLFMQGKIIALSMLCNEILQRMPRREQDEVLVAMRQAEEAYTRAELPEDVLSGAQEILKLAAANINSRR